MDWQWVFLQPQQSVLVIGVTFAEPVPRCQQESCPRFIFFSIYGHVILHKPPAGWNGDLSGVLSHCFFSLGMRMGKRAKGKLLQDSGGSWKGSVGLGEQREDSGRSSLGVEKFLPHPSLISASLHLLSGRGSPPSCPSSNYSNSLSIFLSPFCSHSSCLPSAALFLHFSDCDTCLGLWKSRRRACRSWAVCCCC